MVIQVPRPSQLPMPSVGSAMVVILTCCGLLAGCGTTPTPIPTGFTPVPVPSASLGRPVPLPDQAWTFQGWGVSLAWWSEIVGGWRSADQRPLVLALFGNPQAQSWPIVGGRSVPPLGMTIVRYNVGASPASGALDGCHASFRPGAAVPTVLARKGHQVRLEADFAQLNVLKSAYDLILSQGGQPVVQAFANSPPYWLVPGNCPQGTNTAESLNREAQRQFVQYLARVSAGLQADGVKVASVEPFNEPTTPWPNGCSSGCQEGAGLSLGTQKSIVSQLCKALPTGVSIAAPDDASPEDTIGAWQSYLKSVPCVDQVDTHSYQNGPSAYIGPYRPILSRLVRKGHRVLWMSEFGSASPITIAIQIADDLNQLHPDAWIYWTAMEGPGGWGLFDDPLLANGNVADPGIGKLSATERYFAIGQFIRFIRPGDIIVPVSGSYPSGVRVVVAHTMANGLVAVVVNPVQASEPLSIDLAQLGITDDVSVKVYRTDASNSEADLPHVAAVFGGILKDMLPPMSVSTYVLGRRDSERDYG